MRRRTDRLVAACTVLCVLCTVAVGVFSVTVLDTHQQAQDLKATQDQIQAGRKAGQRIVCAATGAVIDAGRALITGGQPAPGAPLTELERNLRRLGYPPRKVRRAQAKRAAAAYGAQIAAVVGRETNVRGIVARDGSLDCDRLAAATGTK